MSRLIKYRAYLKGFKKMCAVKSIDLEMGTLWVKHGFKDTSPIYDFIGVHAVPLMQYTGINDKNGVEIYEGDIVSIKSPVVGDGVHSIKFMNGSFRTGNGPSLLGGCLQHEIEVIGNIHENPELLEDK